MSEPAKQRPRLLIQDWLPIAEIGIESVRERTPMTPFPTRSRGKPMFERIEIHPRVCNGNPVIRGTRIPVAVILDHLAAGESWESILEGYPELSREDISAALIFAREFIEHTEIVSAVTA